MSVPVVVISSYVPGTLEDRLNEREYLAALLSFAQEQVTVPGTPPAPLDTGTLASALGQPAGRLSQPLSAAADRGSREVNQLRVPVELLRAHIAATHTATGPGAAGESSYRSAAYAALLAGCGTSYAELRLARGAAPAARQALAARLGIRLSATRPDELDQLVLDGVNLTETALETLFGLPASTDADPLREPPTPLLLTWQLAGLTLSWAEQDQHPPAPRAFAVLGDPDVIGAPDVAPGPKGDPIRLLLTQRAAQLASYVKLLDGLRTGAADAAHGLAAMEAQALPGVDLADLEAKDGQGADISAALESAGLTRERFPLPAGTRPARGHRRTHRRRVERRDRRAHRRAQAIAIPRLAGAGDGIRAVSRLLRPRQRQPPGQQVSRRRPGSQRLAVRAAKPDRATSGHDRRQRAVDRRDRAGGPADPARRAARRPRPHDRR